MAFRRRSLVFGITLALAVMFASFSSPTAWAAPAHSPAANVIAPRIIAPPHGNCAYYVQNNNSAEYPWGTYICVTGPYYDSSGRYYTVSSSCWINSLAGYQEVNYPGIGFNYALGCFTSTTDGNWIQNRSGNNTYFYWSTPNPAISFVIQQNVRAGHTMRVNLFTSSVVKAVDDKYYYNWDTVTSDPSDDAYVQVYLP